MSDASGTLVVEVPELRLRVPLAGEAQVFSTQVVMVGMAGFGIGSGVPKLQPVLVQSGPAVLTGGAALENQPHDRGLRLVDLPPHAGTLRRRRAGDRDVVVPNTRPPATCPARAFRNIASVVRCRAFSRSSSSAKAVSESMILSVGESSVRSRSSRQKNTRTPAVMICLSA